MSRVVFVSPQSPTDSVTGFLAGVALFAAVISATMTGWNSGGPLLAILYGLLMLITFPFLLTFSTILFLAFYPILAWPGSWLADRLGWTWNSPEVLKRMWLQRVSVVLVLVPVFWMMQHNAVSVLGLLTGMAAFGLLMVGLVFALPVLLIVGLFFYAMLRSRSSGVSESTVRWTPFDPPKLPPPE